jgi:hypothetical protein
MNSKPGLSGYRKQRIRPPEVIIPVLNQIKEPVSIRYVPHSSQIFQYKLKRKKKPCISISIYEGRLFVCFVLFGLVPWRLDLRCRSS